MSAEHPFRPDMNPEGLLLARRIVDAGPKSGKGAARRIVREHDEAEALGLGSVASQILAARNPLNRSADALGRAAAEHMVANMRFASASVAYSLEATHQMFEAYISAWAEVVPSLVAPFQTKRRS